MAHKKSYQQLTDELTEAAKLVPIGSRHSHYKKPENIYKVVDLAVQEATDKICVIYEPEYMNTVKFVRDLDDWLEQPVVNGKPVERFKRIKV